MWNVVETFFVVLWVMWSFDVLFLAKDNGVKKCVFQTDGKS